MAPRESQPGLASAAAEAPLPAPAGAAWPSHARARAARSSGGATASCLRPRSPLAGTPHSDRRVLRARWRQGPRR
eukprot:scaffold61608_cov60-Phaeocystis_antarctica.AAC.1